MNALGWFLFGCLLGSLLGALALSRWFVKSLKDPKKATDYLHRIYQQAHPHWLQISKEDATKVCPVCGWREDHACKAPAEPKSSPPCEG